MSRTTTIVALLVMALSLTLAACGGGDSSTSGSGTEASGGGSEAATSTSEEASSDGGSSASIVAEAEERLAEIGGPVGTYEKPASGGVKAPSGKKLYVVSFGESLPYFAEMVKATKTAAETLGWSVEVWDGKFQPNLWLAGVRQGVTAKADAIMTLGIDCPNVKPGLEEAERARIPVVSVEGYDCSVVEQGAKSHFAWTVTYLNGITLTEYAESAGRAQADWTIAHTEGKGKVIMFEETDAYTLRNATKGFNDQIEKCTECEVVDRVEMTAADFGPPLEQKATQAILANPDAEVIFPTVEGALVAGISSAIRTSTSKPIATGWEGDPTAPASFASGVLGMNLNEVPGWAAYAGVDAVVRILAGEKPTRDTGIGLRLIDKEHNFDSFEPFVAPIDYQAAYAEGWKEG